MIRTIIRWQREGQFMNYYYGEKHDRDCYIELWQWWLCWQFTVDIFTGDHVDKWSIINDNALLTFLLYELRFSFWQRMVGFDLKDGVDEDAGAEK